jgi:hypothetical protein
VKVRFLKRVESNIGEFFEGDVKVIEDQYTVDQWVSVGLIEIVEEVTE